MAQLGKLRTFNRSTLLMLRHGYRPKQGKILSSSVCAITEQMWMEFQSVLVLGQTVQKIPFNDYVSLIGIIITRPVFSGDVERCCLRFRFYPAPLVRVSFICRRPTPQIFELTCVATSNLTTLRGLTRYVMGRNRILNCSFLEIKKISKTVDPKGYLSNFWLCTERLRRRTFIFFLSSEH